jgi:hypothetical protein
MEGQKMKYTDKIYETVRNALNTYTNLDTQRKTLREQLQRENITAREYQRQLDTLNAQQAAVRLQAAQTVAATGEAYRNAVTTGTELDATTMLHPDAELLRLDGLTLTQHQFDSLVQKHMGNPLMLQLLSNYAAAHEGLYSSIPTPESKIAAFADFCSTADSVLREPVSLRTGFFLDGKCTPADCTESE